MKGGWNAAIDALWWLPDAGLHFANRWLVRPETLAARHRPQGRESSVSSSLIVSTDVNVAFNGSKVLLGSWAEVPFEVARERLAGAMKTLVALGIFWIECSGPRHNRNFVVASLSRKHACLAQAYYSTDVYIFFVLSSCPVLSKSREIGYCNSGGWRTIANNLPGCPVWGSFTRWGVGTRWAR